jgi:transposase-like protein
MDDRVAKLQPRVRALHRGQAGSQIRYPEDLRAEIIAVARAGRTAGRSVYRLAREIGVSAPTLIEWLRRPTRGHLRQVAVAPATVTTMTSTRNPVVVTPHGFRIEGLDLAGLVTVLRDLA